MPERIAYSDQNGYDVETYAQIYNCLGFLMQVEVEAASAIIQAAKIGKRSSLNMNQFAFGGEEN